MVCETEINAMMSAVYNLAAIVGIECSVGNTLLLEWFDQRNNCSPACNQMSILYD